MELQKFQLLKIYGPITVILFLTPVSQALDISERFDFSGYLRAGVGTSSKGGDQECFHSARGDGMPPNNEMRLGNECGIYGEMTFNLHGLKGEVADNEFFRTQIRLAFFPPGHTAYESNDDDGRDINIVEAFAEGGQFDGSPLKFWAGKRYYRDVDVHMYDWYYFAEMNGSGAGVSGIPAGFADLAVAYLVESEDMVFSDSGRHTLQVLDFRLFDHKLSENDSLNWWGAYGWTTAGEDATAGTRYESVEGWLLGVRYRRKLAEGFNDLTVIHGRGAMESLRLSGVDPSQEAETSTLAEASRFRFIEHMTWAPLNKLEFHFAAVHERWDTGASTDNLGTWTSFGARPVYFFTDHYQLALEAGTSFVDIQSEKDPVTGESLGQRQLTRLTISPQVAASRSIWGRPVLRAFYTQSFWNDANKSVIGESAPSYAKMNSGSAIGFQMEAWW